MLLRHLFERGLDESGREDIQGLILRLYRMPFGLYLFLKFEDAAQGRRWLEQVRPRVTSTADWDRAGGGATSTVNVAFTHAGLAALGLSEESLASFAPEFQEGMAARAEYLGDTGASAPDHWDGPFGTDPGGLHALLIAFAADEPTRQRLAEWHAGVLRELPAVSVVYQQDAALLPTGREHFGYRDGIGAPAIEGSGVDPLPGQAPVVRTGEFILGYRDETGKQPRIPQPDELGGHGSYLVIRKLRQDVAGFRAFLGAKAATLRVDEELLAAKLMGRWRSGAPLVLAPTVDDPDLGADPLRNNDFGFSQLDPNGLACPISSHIRRNNARDDRPEKIAQVQRHRVARVGMPYGPPLPEGAADDGLDRGLMFGFFGASIERQFEFVQSAWLNDGDFRQLGTDRDPIAGANDGGGHVVLPWRPVRKRLTGIPRFVWTRGGGYFFMPSLTALDHLARPL